MTNLNRELERKRNEEMYIFPEQAVEGTCSKFFVCKYCKRVADDPM